jgi:hypothetical protein
MTSSIIVILNQINGIYSLIILILGAIGNFFCAAICLRPSLRKVPTFNFYCVLLSCDAFALCVWNLDHYLLIFHETQLENHGIISCKISTFVQCFSLQYSAWLLVSMTVERYLSIIIPNWRNNLFNIKKSISILLAIGFITFVLNLSFAINLTYEMANDTVECFGEPTYYIWMQVN